MDHVLNVLFGLLMGSILYLCLTDVNIIDESIVAFIICVIIAYPWRIGKNVYSLFGGFNFEEAEEQDKKDGQIWSVISIIQYAQGNAFALINFCQYSKEGSALSIIAVSLFQYAEESCVSIVGISLFQKSESDIAVFAIGLSFWQKAEYGDAVMLVGISIFQIGIETQLFCGASLLQKAEKEAMLCVGLVLFQISHGYSIIYGGLSVVQNSEKKSFLGVGIPVFQNNRSFGFKAITDRSSL
ncbi:MAG: hypothetical protein V1765_00575 [bacterium]